MSSPWLGVSGRSQSWRRRGLTLGGYSLVLCGHGLTLGGRGRRLALLACSNGLGHEARETRETREVESQPTRWRPGRTTKNKERKHKYFPFFFFYITINHVINLEAAGINYQRQQIVFKV